MSNNNTFSSRRFSLLFKQHFIHNNKLLLYSTVAYVGVVFLLLSLVQVAENFYPHDLENFRGFLIGFVLVCGILYTGYAFPAFRSKESSINYIMVPGSVLEKFLFELVSRIGLILILLPFLYWVTFNMQGYFFTLFMKYTFEPVGIQYLTKVEIPDEVDGLFWFVTLVASGVMLGFILPFTGAAMFSKQPLIKTLFAVAIIITLYSAYAYVVVEHLGLANYNPNDSLWLIPNNVADAYQFFGIALILANLIMIILAYRKLKEREV